MTANNTVEAVQKEDLFSGFSCIFWALAIYFRVSYAACRGMSGQEDIIVCLVGWFWFSVAMTTVTIKLRRDPVIWAWLKKFAFILLLTAGVFLTLSSRVSAAEILVGQGCMSYPWGEGEIAFWFDGSCGGGGKGGIINAKTKLTINGKTATKRDLKYLSKKTVQYRLVTWTKGKGEGSKTYTTDLQILTDEDMP